MTTNMNVPALIRRAVCLNCEGACEYCDPGPKCPSCHALPIDPGATYCDAECEKRGPRERCGKLPCQVCHAIRDCDACGGAFLDTEDGRSTCWPCIEGTRRPDSPEGGASKSEGAVKGGGCGALTCEVCGLYLKCASCGVRYLETSAVPPERPECFYCSLGCAIDGGAEAPLAAGET